MEPQALRGAEVSDLSERIDRARAHGPRAGRHAEWAVALGAVGGDRGAQRGDVHPAALVAGDLVDRANPEAEDLGRLLDTAVTLRGDVEDQRRPRALEPLTPHVPAVLGRRAMARRRERDQRGRGAAARQQPHAPVRGKPDQLHEPAHGGPLDVNGGVVAPGAARVQRRREEVGDDADGRRRRVHPAEEPRVAVAHRVREDGRAEVLQDRFGARAGFAQGLLDERGALVGRHGLKNRARPNRREVVGHEVDGGVSQPAEGFGIEGGRRHDRLLSRGRRRGGRAGARCRPSSIAR